MFLILSIITNEETGGVASLLRGVVDPLVEDEDDEVAKHAEEEHDHGDEVKHNVQGPSEVSGGEKRNHIISNTSKQFQLCIVTALNSMVKHKTDLPTKRY